ncbi:hypothetical protein [Sphingomonas sp. PB4P5]|uniref:hypothetical protein n=1 Tax=Parasphingomonas puruogangriensis TaxID=3096155 RepID=UPI002FC7811D
MKKHLLAALAALGAVVAAVPAAAKEKPPVFVVASAVKDKPAVALDPTKAYILLRTANAAPLYLMKVPTAEDQATYDRVRAAALAEAREKYGKKAASYERARAAAAKSPGLSVPEKPVEPTEANFEFVQFGMMASVGIGPMNRFAKSKELSTYLHEVTAGTYRVYGQLAAPAGAAAIGSCFCMGSVKFDAPAGAIVDLGVIDPPVVQEPTPGDSSQPAVADTKPLFRPAGTDMPIDPRLSAAKIVSAAFKAVGKLPNYYGVTISRIPEMPGVMRYDRDRIVDLTAQ